MKILLPLLGRCIPSLPSRLYSRKNARCRTRNSGTDTSHEARCSSASTSACTLPVTGKTEEKIIWASVPFTCTSRALMSCLILPSVCFAVSLVPTWRRSKRQESVVSSSCSNLSVTSRIVAPSKQQSSLDCTSNRKLGASSASQQPVTHC